MKWTQYWFSLFLILSLTGCGNGLVPLTRQTIDNHGLTLNDLKHLQFYTSEEARFFKLPEKTASKSIQYGDLRTQKGLKTEVLVLEEGTPGILADSASDFLLLPIDFDEVTLPFVSSLSGRYILRMRNSSGRSVPVQHQGETYIPFSSITNVTLLVDHDDLDQINSSGDIIEGRELGWWDWFWGP